MNLAFPYHTKEKPFYFVAEIGSNHNQSTQRLTDIIYQAKEIGCDAIKLQYFSPNTLWHSDFKPFIKQAKQRALPFKLLQTAFDICIHEDISLGVSVFDIDDVQKVSEHCNFLKIASYESQYTALIKECLSTDLPLFISTGMCSPLEIIDTWELIRHDSNNVLFHCMSQYPFSGDTLTRYFIDMFGNQFPLNQFGYSDHTVNPDNIKNAIKLGASIIECHLDLNDTQGYEYSHNHCWTVSQLKSCIKKCKKIKHNYGEPCCAVNTSIEKLMLRPDRKDLKYRVDPSDGMRPLKIYRKSILEEIENE